MKVARGSLKTRAESQQRRSPVAQSVNDVVDGDLDKIGLAKDMPVDRHSGWNRFLNFFECSVQRPASMLKCLRRAASGVRESLQTCPESSPRRA